MNAPEANWTGMRRVPHYVQKPAANLPVFDPIEEEATYWREYEANPPQPGFASKVLVVALFGIAAVMLGLRAGWV